MDEYDWIFLFEQDFNRAVDISCDLAKQKVNRFIDESIEFKRVFTLYKETGVLLTRRN
jgi:hypothetical protein